VGNRPFRAAEHGLSFRVAGGLVENRGEPVARRGEVACAERIQSRGKPRPDFLGAGRQAVARQPAPVVARAGLGVARHNGERA
jgi:hypothetical protein